MISMPLFGLILMAQQPPAAAPTAAAQERVLVMDFKVAGAPPEMGSAVANIVAVELGKSARFDVVTAKDLRALLDREATKQGMGCDVAAGNCLADLAGALGAKLVVYGDVSKLDSTYLVNVNLFDASRAVGLGRENIEVTSADELPTRVSAAARRLVDGGASGPGVIALVAGAGAGVGVVAVVAGSLGALAAFRAETDPTSSGSTKVNALAAHPFWSLAAAAGAVVAIASGATAVVMWDAP
jgi:hypothetical protein